MSEQSGPTPEEMGITSIVPENTVRLIDVVKATEYAEKGVSPEKYYEKRWDETILLSDELTEEQKLQWTKPQIFMVSGMSRSGKSIALHAIEREYLAEGIETSYFSSDTARLAIAEEVEKDLKEKIAQGALAPQDYARVREEMIYSPTNKQRVYEMVYKAAGEALKEGGIVFVDATHLTDKSRHQAYDMIQGAYGEDLPNFTFLEVSNSREHAQSLLDKDKERREKLRQGEVTAEQAKTSLHPKGDYFFPIDLSEAHDKIRDRDELTYEPLMEMHIKIINNYPDEKGLVDHIKTIFAKKPEKIDTLWDIEE